jgi:hypothetical protein
MSTLHESVRYVSLAIANMDNPVLAVEVDDTDLDQP